MQRIITMVFIAFLVVILSSNPDSAQGQRDSGRVPGTTTNIDNHITGESCTVPVPGMNLNQSVTFCPGTFIITSPISLSGQSTVACMGTVFEGGTIGFNMSGMANVTVRGCTFTNFSKAGIFAIRGSFVPSNRERNNTFINNTFVGNGGGINNSAAGYVGDEGNSIDSNIFLNNQVAVSIKQVGKMSITNNQFVGNTVGIDGYSNCCWVQGYHVIANNTITDGVTGIRLSHSWHTIIENNTILTGYALIHGIVADNSIIHGNILAQTTQIGHANQLIDSNVFRGGNPCLRTVMATGMSSSTISNNVFENCGLAVDVYGGSSVPQFNSNYNTFVNNTFANSSQGMRIGPNAENNTIYHNNFLNLTTPAQGNGLNFWNLPYPSGGNHWSGFDTSGEGCSDGNGDGFCDSPYLFSGNQDFYPFVNQNGWVGQPANLPPILLSLPDASIFEDNGTVDNLMNLTAFAIDDFLAPQNLTYSIMSQSNPGVVTCSIDSQNFMDCATQQDQNGVSEIVIQVSDGFGADTDSLNITVLPVNDPPQLGQLPNQSLFKNSGFNGNLIDLTAFATDIDTPLQNLTFSVTNQTNLLLVNCMVGPGNFLECWVNPFQSGSSLVTVGVSDGNLANQTTLQVTVMNNSQPLITSAPVGMGIKDVLYTYDVQAFDMDGDTLTFSLNQSPQNMTINPQTGLIQWVPPAFGQYPVTVQAWDGTNGFAYQNFTISVRCIRPGKQTFCLNEADT